MTDLSAFGGHYSYAYAINDQGQIVGYADTPSGQHRAFLYQNGAVRDLGTLHTSLDSYAYALNNRGQVVGSAEMIGDGSFREHACLFQGGKVTDLNRLIPWDSGWTLNEARGINDAGQIVGNGTFKGLTRAFLLTPRASP